MAAQKTTVDQLLLQIRSYDERRADYAVWLGAGASVTSGVPAAGEIVARLLRRAYEAAENKPNGSADSLTSDELYAWANKLEWFRDDGSSEYARAMKNVYQSPGQRKQFLEKILSNTKPSPGYQMLGVMLERGVFDTLFTTN